MPASLKKLRDTGGMVLLHVCETCGAPAPFGFGVSLRLALERMAAGDKATAKRHLGRWYCGEHRADGEGSA